MIFLRTCFFINSHIWLFVLIFTAIIAFAFLLWLLLPFFRSGVFNQQEIYRQISEGRKILFAAREDLYLKNTLCQGVAKPGDSYEVAMYRLARKIASALPKTQKHFTILDLGAGQGALYFYLKKNLTSAFSYTAVDINSDYATNLKGINAINLNLIQQDMYQFVQQDKLKYDAILGIESLFHHPQKKNILNLVANKLKTGGVFILADLTVRTWLINWKRFYFFPFVFLYPFYGLIASTLSFPVQNHFSAKRQVNCLKKRNMAVSDTDYTQDVCISQQLLIETIRKHTTNEKNVILARYAAYLRRIRLSWLFFQYHFVVAKKKF